MEQPGGRQAPAPAWESGRASRRRRIVREAKGWFRNFKIIYRRYAGLYFCICVDVNDNNLAYLEAIHNFVEVLNEYFHNVCELDLVFNFYKVYTVVDEMFLAGEIRETSQTKVLKQLLMLQSLE
uniref:AP complex mu/sigma subunit domain-containing protein n=1 Tax=Equus asinus asinus TaxID=83772 RepID=A0A8C4L4A6_EQUAS